MAKKLRKILESKPKSTVALKSVIHPAGMALDIEIFHAFSAGIKHWAGYIFLLGLTVYSTAIVTLLPFSRIGVCGLQME